LVEREFAYRRGRWWGGSGKTRRGGLTHEEEEGTHLRGSE